MRFALLAALPLMLAACAAPVSLPDAARMAAAADSAAIRPTTVTNLLPDYRPRPVVAPGDWRLLNDQQAPSGALSR